MGLKSLGEVEMSLKYVVLKEDREWVAVSSTPTKLLGSPWGMQNTPS
jgi:hypothetical protein